MMCSAVGTEWGSVIDVLVVGKLLFLLSSAYHSSCASKVLVFIWLSHVTTALHQDRSGASVKEKPCHPMGRTFNSSMTCSERDEDEYNVRGSRGGLPEDTIGCLWLEG